MTNSVINTDGRVLFKVSMPFDDAKKGRRVYRNYILSLECFCKFAYKIVAVGYII